MAPTKAGGRPKIPWNASRKRKLVRLYLMTNLKIEEIKEVLIAHDFKPGNRNIQAQLSDLLPENVDEWRRYRPSGYHEGRRRLKHLHRCQTSQISRHLRRRQHLKSTAKVPARAPSQVSLKETTHLYNPSRYYDHVAPFGLPSHIALPSLSAWYSANAAQEKVQNPNMSVSSDVRDGYSDKEVVPITGPSPIEQALTLDTDRLLCSSTFATFPATGEPILEKYTDQEGHAHTLPRLERSDSRVSSIKSMSARSARSISVSISSNLSDGLSLINSIMSQSISWRSSLAYAMSISSGKLSNLSWYAFSREELHIWDELVDESKLESEPACQSDIGAVSLYSRPCCSFFEDNVDGARAQCPTCGFSKIHQLARLSKCNYLGELSLLDDMPADRFGNTVLHHAAAAGNLERVLKLITSQGKESKPLLQLRNTSGEAFLHVLRLNKLSEFPEYLQILRKTCSEKFDFGIKTYCGKSVFHQFEEVMHNLNADPTQFRLATASCILGLHDLTTSGLPLRHAKNSITSHCSSRPSPLQATDDWHMPHDTQGATRLVELQGNIQEVNNSISKTRQASGNSEASSPNGDPYNQTQTALNSLNHYLTETSTSLISSKFLDTINNNQHDPRLLWTLQNWEKHSKSSFQLRRMIERSEIHVRDKSGYTALAIAARQGIYKAVSLLLKHGANPNTRSWQRTSVLSHAAMYLARAQKANNERLYAKILSCMTLLIDYGAREQVSVLEEYSVYIPPDKRSGQLHQKYKYANINRDPFGEIYNSQAADIHWELPWTVARVSHTAAEDASDTVAEGCDGGETISESQELYLPSPVVNTNTLRMEAMELHRELDTSNIFEMEAVEISLESNPPVCGNFPTRHSTATQVTFSDLEYNHVPGSIAECQQHRVLEHLHQVSYGGQYCPP